MMMACSLLSYFDRQILAVLSPMILAETNLSAQAYSQIISAFSIAYMVGNPFWGSILDRVGVRNGMTISVALWTVASTAHAFTAGFAGFAMARAFLGFGEGATFPGGLRTVIETLPPKKQARGIALAYSGGSLGAILTPILVTPVALAYGWRAAFWLTGLAGAIWIVAWRKTSPFRSATRAGQITFPNPAERRFWSLVGSYALGAFPLAPVLYLGPLYLTRVVGFTQAELGRVLWLPPLGWEIGYFFWGWIADRHAASNPKPAWLFFLLAALGLPLTLVTAFTSPVVVLGLMFWSMFIAAGFVVISLRTGALQYPKENTALVAGVGAGSWSAVVSLVLPVLGHLFDQERYSDAFAIVGLLPGAGTILWWLLNRGRRSPG